MLQVTQIKQDRIIVDDGSGGVAIAKYEDAGGVYFFDEKLNKAYAEDRMKPALKRDYLPREWDKKERRTVNKKNKYTLRTTIYDREGWGPGRTYERTFKARSIKEAEQKVEANYKAIFDCELIRAVDANGKTFNPF